MSLSPDSSRECEGDNRKAHMRLFTREGFATSRREHKKEEERLEFHCFQHGET